MFFTGKSGDLPDTQDMLHSQAYQCYTRPAAGSGKNRFASGFNEFDDICVKSDGSHCHNNEKFAQFLQRSGYSARKLKESGRDRGQYEKQNKKWKGFFQAE